MTSSMTPLQAVILGVVQGLTEFLPVSSSGHLVLGQHLFGIQEADLLFDVSVHLATLGAVCLFFRREIAGLLRACPRLLRVLFRPAALKDLAASDPEARMVLFILAGSVPTGLIGLPLSKFSDTLFSSVPLAGVCLLITAGLLWTTRRAGHGDGDAGPEAPVHDLTLFRALVIGTVQGIAILPGISRSGSTIVAGLFLGLSREMAARFSFLLCIPAILGAQILGMRHVSLSAIPAPVFLGMASAAVTGYAALTLLVYIVNRGRLFVFAPYCAAVGLLAVGLGIA